jgi:hypothetical protein
MSKQKFFILLSGLVLILAMLACNAAAPTSTPTPVAASGLPSDTPQGSAAPSLTEIPTGTQTAAPAASLTPVPATNTLVTPSVTITPTPQNPLVTATAYCWSGPTGKTLKYELISSIQAGTRVQLLGRGIVDGWWVIKNPRYNDPCWIQMQYVQIDIGYDLSTLKTFAVPATPTATP